MKEPIDPLEAPQASSTHSFQTAPVPSGAASQDSQIEGATPLTGLAFFAEDWFDTIQPWKQVFPQQSKIERLIPPLLDLLDEMQSTATFFWLGRAAVRNPRLVREVHRRGHESAVAGWSNSRDLGLESKQISVQVRDTSYLIEDLTSAKVLGYHSSEHFNTGPTNDLQKDLLRLGIEYVLLDDPLSADYGQPKERGALGLNPSAGSESIEKLRVWKHKQTVAWPWLRVKSPFALTPLSTIEEGIEASTTSVTPFILSAFLWDIAPADYFYRLPFPVGLFHYKYRRDGLERLRRLLAAHRFETIQSIRTKRSATHPTVLLTRSLHQNVD